MDKNPWIRQKVQKTKQHLNIIMKEYFIEGAVYGLFSAATMYAVVQYAGYNPQTLALLIYIQIISGILINMKSEIEALSLPYLKKLVLVHEGENIEMRKLSTGEKYRIRGDVEKL